LGLSEASRVAAEVDEPAHGAGLGLVDALLQASGVADAVECFEYGSC
jgi:hypothetical protein